jgi:hypothetical protein
MSKTHHSFFSLVDQIEVLLKENEKLSCMISSQESAGQDRLDVMLSSVLKRKLLNAESNSQKFAKHRRYDSVLTKFATSLFIFAGPLAYNFVQSNMPNALPSLRTVQRKVNSDYQVILEGEFRFDELLLHLKNYNSPLIVSIGEDATRLNARVDYDHVTDRLFGFVMPVNEQALPMTDTYLATSFTAIENFFSNSTIANMPFCTWPNHCHLQHLRLH